MSALASCTFDRLRANYLSLYPLFLSQLHLSPSTANKVSPTEMTCLGAMDTISTYIEQSNETQTCWLCPQAPCIHVQLYSPPLVPTDCLELTLSRTYPATRTFSLAASTPVSMIARDFACMCL